MLFRTTRRARAAALTLTVATAFVLAGCGGNAAAPAEKKAAPQSTAKGQTLTAVSPLTGLPVKGAEPDHPPVIVKIDNTVSSQPQVGLAQADLITEELVEGGLTRLAVFFDTTIPTLVGPVRSMRASDIGLVKPVHGVVVTSGAAGPTIGRLRSAGVDFRSNDGGATGFFREGGRHAPYDLMMHLTDLVKTLERPAETTPPYLAWGTTADFAGTQPARSITARFGNGHTTQWQLQGTTYQNTNSNARLGTRFRPDTVIAVRVDLRDAGYRDPAGNFVPESVTTGSGPGMIFHRGKALKVTWSKAGVTKNWVFKDAAGKVVQVPAGHTWIEVMPIDAKGGNLTFGG